jgi:soluble lytic murein transglycosylase
VALTRAPAEIVGRTPVVPQEHAVPMKLPPRSTLAAGTLGLAMGLAIGTTRSGAERPHLVPAVSEIVRSEPLDPFRGLTHAGMILAVRSANEKLDAGRPWAAWNVLKEYVEEPEDAPAGVTLLAARSAAGWDAWSHVRRLLQGREWLAGTDGGAGLLLLGRAEEARGEWGAAADAYRRYAAAAAESGQRGVARARLARALVRQGNARGAATAYGQAADDLPLAADWLRALQAEALAAAGEPSAASLPTVPGASAAAIARRARAEAAAWTKAGHPARATDALAGAARALALHDPALAAEVSVEQARRLEEAGRAGEAAEVLRRVAADTLAARAVRVDAATRLGKLPGERTVDEELARAAAYEAGAKPGLAAKSLRAAVQQGAPDDFAMQLRIGRLLVEERDPERARVWLKKAMESAPDAASKAEAALYAARALVRAGDRNAGRAALRRVADEYPGTAAAGTAWYLLGDGADDRKTGIVYYRRAADVAASPHAREALFRVGDRSLKEKDPAGAARAWEEYAARWPRGEQTAEAAYRAGRIHEKAGREGAARALYDAAVAADPVSYFAVRAADRLGADPLARAVAEPKPWMGLADDRAQATAALARLAVLEDAGLDDAWKEELAHQARRFDRRHLALLALAEGVRDRGHTIEAIRIGRDLLEKRGGAWDARLLRVVFPFPYRELLIDEAERVDVDPYLLAGLVRQESSFDRKARSWVGATGLSQIMPATGAWLAPGIGIQNFETALLTVPEINLRMGARYLRDQNKRYRGARDLALAAYNAGPGRADRWKRELGYGGDPDAFREKIPFAETRHYVKVVIRNAEIYRRLYGPERHPGLAVGDE